MNTAKHKLPMVTVVLISAVAIIFTINYVFALGTTTNNFNWAGGRQSTANFSAVLNAIGADETVCATQGTAAATQQFDNFGFTLPPAAILHGIRVQVLGSISAGSDTWSVFLRKNETGARSPITITGSVTSTAACGGTQETITFGNLTGTFGQSWTASELDDDGFTVGISLPAVGAGTRRINWVRVEANYSLPTTTTTLTSTTTTTLTSTFNTTVTYNSTITSTVTSTTTLTSTFNVTNTFNTTLTSTTTTTVTNTVTSTSTVTSTFNTTNTFNVTSTATSTTTVTSTTVVTTETCTQTSQTMVFFDGFESGNFAKWNATASGNLGTINVTSHKVINGTYSEYVVIGNNINGFGYAEGTANLTQFHSNSVQVWLQMYEKINPFQHNSGAETHFLEVRNATGDIIHAGFFHDAYGNHELEIELQDPDAGNIVLRSGPIMVDSGSVDDVEIGFNRASTGGFLRAYLNGTLVIDYMPSTSLNRTAFNITAFRVGVLENSGGQKNFNATLDNISLAKNRIGKVCYPISTISTTTTFSSTSTITAAVCSALLCANTDFYGEASPWWIMVVLIGLMFGGAIVIGRRRKVKEQLASGGSKEL